MEKAKKDKRKVKDIKRRRKVDTRKGEKSKEMREKEDKEVET